MKNYALILGGLAVLAIIALWTVNVRTARAPGDGKACTMEAKICPDGSAVGRTGPNCEFTPCPVATATTTTTTGGGQSILPYKSGVRGTVSLGPTCPVMRIPPDPQCADKPYATSLVVTRIGGSTPFLIGNSNADGTFQFSLPPGSYTLSVGGGKMLPRCSPVTVTVGARGYTGVAISCDTGIR